MSRINEAMKRAGQVDPDTESGSVDETVFATGETVESHIPPDDVSADVEVEEPASLPETIGVPLVRIGGQRAVAPMPRPVLELRSNERRDEVAIRDVFRMLFARWKLIAAIVAVSVGIAAVLNARTVPIYQATLRLVIEPDTTQIVQRTVQEDTYRSDYFGTQLDVLRSRNLARKTLQRLGMLSGDPAQQDEQIGMLAGSLIVAPPKQTVSNRTVNVSVLSADPRYAARMANGSARRTLSRISS